MSCYRLHTTSRIRLLKFPRPRSGALADSGLRFGSGHRPGTGQTLPPLRASLIFPEMASATRLRFAPYL